MSDDDDVLTFPAAMKVLKVGRSALYRAVARNQVPHRRVGKCIRFSRSALVAWLGGDLKDGEGSRLTSRRLAR